MMIGLGHQADADACHTPLMGMSGQARSLGPHELAQASVIGALCAAIAIIAVVLPHAGGLGLLGAALLLKSQEAAKRLRQEWTNLEIGD